MNASSQGPIRTLPETFLSKIHIGPDRPFLFVFVFFKWNCDFFLSISLNVAEKNRLNEMVLLSTQNRLNEMVLLSTHNICFDKHQIFDNALLSGGLEYTYLFLSFLFSILHIELKMEGGGTTRECLKDKKLE